MSENLIAYCNRMQEIRGRIGLIASVLDGVVRTGSDSFDAELMFVQFRKSLELIAFASLIANKRKYSEAHENFASHWKAKGMLNAIAKLNPHFYPAPIEKPKVLESGVKHCDPITEGFLTKPEFEFLYDKSSEVLHARNPFSTGEPVVRIRYGVADWVARIQRLLALHVTHLVDGTVWIIEIPNEGPVRGYAGK